MYNGIGLPSARGSGTNGYIQRNLAYIKPREQQSTYKEEISARSRSPDRSILEHEQKRKVEIAVLELKDDLEEKGVPEDEIEDKADALRQELLAKPVSATSNKQFKGHERHAIAAAKALEMQRINHAFGTRGNYKEGDAFDRELQERKRIERIERREHHEVEKIQRERDARERSRRQVERELDERERYRRRSPSYEDGRRRSPSYDSRDRSRSPPRRRSDSPYYNDRRSYSPRPRSRSPSYSRSPSPRRESDLSPVPK